MKSFHKFLIVFIIAFVFLFMLFSCNPCRYVAKHPECFRPDTVKLIEKVISVQKEYITNDSIVYDSIPCNPITETVVKTSTIWKTKHVIKVDTIYTDKVVDRINPVNEQMKKDLEKALNKNNTKNKLLFGLITLILVLALIRKIFFS